MPSRNFPYTIIYLTNMRVPTEKAHGLATAKICEAFVDAGVNLELVAPKLRRTQQGDFFDYYKLKNRFPIFLLPTIDFLKFGVFQKAAFLVQLFLFCVAATLFCLKHYGGRKERIVFFSHDSVPLFFISFFFPNIFYDIHHFPGKSFVYNRVMRKSVGFAVQTRWKVQALAKEFGVPEKKIVYWPNGTDAKEFDISVTMNVARRMLGLPEDKKIILYTGQLFDWKGVKTLLSAAPLLPSNVLVYSVGGGEEDVRRIQATLPTARDQKIRYVPFQPHEKIPLWLRAADVLVLPNTGKQKVSLYYTSPMKLFEYMASGTPIVASNIPSIREVLHEKTGFFMNPDDSRSCADAIMGVLNNKEAYKVGEAAKQEVQKYTWDTRAQKILDFMEARLQKRGLWICFLAHNTHGDNGGGVLASKIIEGLTEFLPAKHSVITTVPGGLFDSQPLLASPREAVFKNFFAIRSLFSSCDIVHAFDIFPFGLIASIIGLGLNKKIIITATGSGSLVPLYSFWYGPLSAWVCRHADAVVAISRFTRDEILKKIPKLSIQVINPGIVPESSVNRELSLAVRRYQPYILSVGALRWRKGYGITIRAFAKIKKSFPDLHYVIVGKRYTDKEYQKLQKIIAEERLEKSVHILDSINDERDKQELYRGAELFALLSQNTNHDVEGFGIVFLEAAAAGLPVVGSRGCGAEDAVQDGINGILVNKRDGNAFADAVIRILRSNELKKRMSEASLAFVRENTWKKKYTQYIEVYRKTV